MVNVTQTNLVMDMNERFMFIMKTLFVCYLCGKVGHLTSKCKDRPRIGVSNAFKANTRKPKKIWVPKKMIILVADVLDSRKQMPIMVPG